MADLPPKEVSPTLHVSSQSWEEWRENTISLTWPCVWQMLSSVAKEAGIWLIGGSIPERQDGQEKLWNTATVWDPQGEWWGTREKEAGVKRSLIDDPSSPRPPRRKASQDTSLRCQHPRRNPF